MEGPNGRVEAEVFKLAEPFGVGSFHAAVLCALPLECLRGMKPDGLVVRSVSLGEVFSNLFAAAADGGAYAASSWRGGAHGRAALWESVAALVGTGCPVCRGTGNMVNADIAGANLEQGCAVNGSQLQLTADNGTV
jgi:hypothetical protein